MPATEIKLPELGENLDGGEVLDVKVAVGDTVETGQTLMEIEAEKSTVEVPAPMAGRLRKLLVKKGDYVKVNQSICLIDANGQAAAPESAEPPASEPTNEAKPAVDGKASAAIPKPTADLTATVSSARSSGAVVPAGPATRRLARELGLDLGQVPGSAPKGRVTQEDVKAYVRRLASGATAGRGAAASEPPLPDFEKWGPVERQPLDPVRRRTADLVSTAWRLIPHVTQHDLADVTDLEAFRKQQVSAGPKMTVTAFVLKAAAIALKEFAQFNASLDTASNELILKRYYHIGVAVDTDRGLLVPVLRDVERKSVQELAAELGEVAERARNKKTTADEMRGGTFTITNLGGIGGTGFSPIINYPQVAILGLARSRLQPVVRDNEIVPRLLLPLSLSYDHRVIDGADAARFTRRIAEMLENPLVMLLHA
jgi:pyruvate dehydrogenase E2 component (dihydrolipoamide acetyltransferase)